MQHFGSGVCINVRNRKTEESKDEKLKEAHGRFYGIDNDGNRARRMQFR